MLSDIFIINVDRNIFYIGHRAIYLHYIAKLKKTPLTLTNILSVIVNKILESSDPVNMTFSGKYFSFYSFLSVFIVILKNIYKC